MKKLKLECIICLEKKFYVSKTGCNHDICIDCLFHLKEMSCPMCRSDLTDELPLIVKDHIQGKNKTKKRGIPINDEYEFPPLN